MNRDLAKVMRVLDSCITFPQVEIADKMFELFLKKYPEFIKNRNFLWSKQIAAKHFAIRFAEKLKMEKIKNE